MLINSDDPTEIDVGQRGQIRRRESIVQELVLVFAQVVSPVLGLLPFLSLPLLSRFPHFLKVVILHRILGGRAAFGEALRMRCQRRCAP